MIEVFEIHSEKNHYYLYISLSDISKIITIDFIVYEFQNRLYGSKPRSIGQKPFISMNDSYEENLFKWPKFS